jgi:hypothetical protein
MATEDKQRILDWCGAGSDVRYVKEGDDPSADLSLVLESMGTELTASLAGGSDRIVLRNVVDLAQAAQPAGSGDLAADLTDLEERRPGPVTAVLEPSGEAVAVSTWVFSDGLTQHSFMTAVSEVVRTRGAVLRLAGLPADVPAAEAAGTVAEPEPEEHEAPEVSLSGASTEAVPEMAAVAEQAATSEPSPWAWTPPGPTPTYGAVEPAAPETTYGAAEEAAPEPAVEVPAAAAVPEAEPAAEMPAVEPAAEMPSAEEPVSAFSAWGAATSAAQEPAPEPEPEPVTTTEPAAVQEPAYSPWGSPEVTPAEEPVAETPVAGGQTPAYSPWGSTPLTPEQPAEQAEPAPQATLPGVEQEPVTPSPWATPEATTEEAAPETTPSATEEQPVSPWTSPAATGFEAVASPSQGYQPEATPAAFEATPSPAGPSGGYSAGGSGQDYLQPYTPAVAATPVPAPAPVQPAWTPSHRVPPQGMQAWAAPDPAGAVVATLGGHLPVQVTEVRGAWAHVLCSNGWTGWVDDRLLIVGA